MKDTMMMKVLEIVDGVTVTTCSDESDGERVVKNLEEVVVVKMVSMRQKAGTNSLERYYVVMMMMMRADRRGEHKM